MPTLEEMRSWLEGEDVEGMEPHPKPLFNKEVIEECIRNAPIAPQAVIFSPVTFDRDGSPEEIDVPVGPRPSISDYNKLDVDPTLLRHCVIRHGMTMPEVASVAKRIYKSAGDRVYDQSLRNEDVGLLAIEEDTGDVYQLKGMEPVSIEQLANAHAHRVHHNRPMGIWEAVGTFGVRVDASSFR